MCVTAHTIDVTADASVTVTTVHTRVKADRQGKLPVPARRWLSSPDSSRPVPPPMHHSNVSIRPRHW